MPSKLILTPLLIPIPIYLYNKYLAGIYPTLKIPSNFELNSLTLNQSPSVGFIKSEPGWLKAHAGDLWSVDLPSSLLKNRTNGDGDSMVLQFTKAFWNAWPLKFERFFFTSLLRLGIASFELRGSDEGVNSYDEGAKVIGGLFAVESHNTTSIIPDLNASTFEGPIITSWWIKSSNFIRLSNDPSPEVIGGYHSFVVETLPLSTPSLREDTKEKEEIMVRLHFIAHLILSTSTYDESNSSIPSRDIPGLNFVQRTIMYFHTFYARILLDCAVRNLKSS